MILYKITNKINGKCYIGQTTGTLKERWRNHCRPTNCTALYRAIKKYGKDFFLVEDLASYTNLADLNNAE